MRKHKAHNKKPLLSVSLKERKFYISLWELVCSDSHEASFCDLSTKLAVTHSKATESENPNLSHPSYQLLELG